MKRWVLRISVVLCALVVVGCSPAGHALVGRVLEGKAGRGAPDST